MKSKIFWTILLISACTAVLYGCGSQKASNPTTSSSSVTPTASPLSATPTTSPLSVTPATSEQTPTVEPTDQIKFDSETLKNDTGKTLITCIGDGTTHVSFAIVTSEGTVILTDPVYTSKTGYYKADIITVSHKHADHYNQAYLDKMNGFAKISISQVSDFTVNDAHVYGVLASHTSDLPNAEAPTNIINVYEVDGLRIAYMGSMGQDELSPDQLEKIGKVDIIFTVIANDPAYGPTTEKNIKIIEQLNPKIVLPTHYKEDILQKTIDYFGVNEVEYMSELVINKENLDADSMRFVFLDGMN